MYRVGIAGFGVVGLAGLKFFVERPRELRSFLGLSQDAEICFVIWDKKTYPEEHRALLQACKVTWINAATCSLSGFLVQVDRALVSPGVNLASLDFVERAKTFCELDLFASCFIGKTIGITGSLGKTTVTKLIYKIIQRFYSLQGGTERVALGGNVGVGMLDLLRADELPTLAVLELSSFQLEMSTQFVPSIGVWTNLFPNHLDRHGDMPSYFKAKANLFCNAEAIVLGMQLFDQTLRSLTLQFLSAIQGRLVVAGADILPDDLISIVPRSEWEMISAQNGFLTNFLVKQGRIVDTQPLISLPALPLCTFIQNWATIFASLSLAGVDLAWLAKDIQHAAVMYQPDDHKHRIEFVRQCGGVDFYNDSKSTVKESTLAAVEQMARIYKRVHVVIGGLGKGVDRTDFTRLLETFSAVVSIVAFGKEAHLLGAKISVATLEDALDRVLKHVQPGDVVLFSPGGTSYDLFTIYTQRGDRFKEIVAQLK